ncbi:furin-like protease kpc-1 isoform X2 [Dreissena polymorpha]|uniref:furin-like protease kpc-1 isoform X2 n=1 Tax=Dreissena polymorpha TaxID=45954 RepID=UPI002264DBE6|nr:furin-like protease kpc-1 isoform X2 [Dreissena polymorpha]
MDSESSFLPGGRLLLLALLVAKAFGDDGDYTDTYIVKMNDASVPDVKPWLESHDFKFLSKISDMHIYTNTKPPPTYSISRMLKIWPGKIISMRRVRKQFITYGDDRVEETASMPLCSLLSDTSHAVESAHALGFTGKGVHMALIDKNRELSKNSDSESADMGLEDDKEDPENIRIASHGNIDSSLTEEDDRPLLCAKGVAKGAVVTLLTIGSVNRRDHTIATDITRYSRALQYRRDQIDVYANSWGTDEPLSPCDDIVKDVLKTGIGQGRRGKGSIFVFSSGPVGNCFSNSIYTIAVNGLLANNTVLASSRRSSAVLVSAFVGEKSRIDHAEYEYTHCVAEFETLSSPTAKVAGIVGLIIQVNPKLSWRDVQHLLVNSVQKPYPCSMGWTKNAAGHFFDHFMGFGIVNATQAVLLAQHHKSVPAQVSFQTQFERISGSFSRANVTCTHGCVTWVEHVVLTIEFTHAPVEPFRLTLESPKGTVSILIDCDDLLNHSVNELKAEIMSVHFWDEPSEGIWFLTAFKPCASSVQSDIISNAILVMYGSGHPNSSARNNVLVPIGDSAIIFVICVCVIFVPILSFIMYKVATKNYQKSEKLDVYSHY